MFIAMCMHNRATPPWSTVDRLANEMERLCPRVSVSVGSGQTAYNFYYPTEQRDALVLGILENGEVWTDLAALGPDRAVRLAAGLAGQGIKVDVTKDWTFWRAGRAGLNLRHADPGKIAEAVRSAVVLAT